MAGLILLSLGSKRLKAVAIARGYSAIRVADPDAVWRIAGEMVEALRADPVGQPVRELGTLPWVVDLLSMGALPIRNYTTNVAPEIDIERWKASALRAAFPHRRH